MKSCCVCGLANDGQVNAFVTGASIADGVIRQLSSFVVSTIIGTVVVEIAKVAVLAAFNVAAMAHALLVAASD